MASRDYKGPVIDFEIKTVADLERAMRWLVEQECLPGARPGDSPTNIGETIEAALNQPPSTKRLDFTLEDGKRELKSGRQKISTPDSLGTRILNSIENKPYSGKENPKHGQSKSARYRDFVVEFAYESETTIKRPKKGDPAKTPRMNLYPFLNHRSDHNRTGLYLKYDKKKKRIWVCHGQWWKRRKLLYYDQEDIDEILDKLKLQYYVSAEVKHLGQDRYCYDVTSVTSRQLTDEKMTPKKLFDLVKKGILLINLRAHICDDVVCRIDQCVEWKRSGPGNVRDHNTAIRIEKKKVSEAYDEVKIA